MGFESGNNRRSQVGITALSSSIIGYVEVWMMVENMIISSYPQDY